MAVAIVSGLFTILLAGLSWLLTNGSKGSRLLSRIERQTAVLGDLPPEHPARAELDDSLVHDARLLKRLGAPPAVEWVSPGEIIPEPPLGAAFRWFQIALAALMGITLVIGTVALLYALLEQL